MGSDPFPRPPHWRLRITLMALPMLAISFVLAAQIVVMNRRAARRLGELGESKTEVLLLKDRLREEVAKSMELTKELEISRKQLKAVETARFKTEPQRKMAARAGSDPASDQPPAVAPSRRAHPDSDAVSPRSDATSPALGSGPS